MDLDACENQSFDPLVVLNLGLEHLFLPCCQEVVGGGGGVVCLSAVIFAWPLGPNWLELLASHRSRPEMGALSRFLEFTSLIPHTD